MPRSRSRNRKRARLARQRKKEMTSPARTVQSESRKKIKSRLFRQHGKIEIRENKPGEKKISAVVLKMLRPLLKEAATIEDEKRVVQMGIMAWNMGIIKTFKGEDALQESLQDIKTSIPEGTMDLLMQVVDWKCTRYSKYGQFIYDFEIKRIPGDNINLTVAYESVEG